MEDLKATVARGNTPSAKVNALIGGIVGKIKEAGTDQATLTELTTWLTSNMDGLVEAVFSGQHSAVGR